MRNHEHYIDKTAHEAIKKLDKPKNRIRLPKERLWSDRLTYTIGEVMAKNILAVT